MDSRKVWLLFLVGMLSLIIASGTMAAPKWVLTMTTTNAAGAYTMTLGVTPGATDAYEATVLGDTADALAAPGLPPGQSTRIDSSQVSGVPGGGNLVQDIRSDKSTLTWPKLVLVADAAKPSTLSWDLSQVPAERTVTLTATGTFLNDLFQPILTTPIDMRAVSSVGPIAVAAGTLAVAIGSSEPPTTFSGKVILANSGPTIWSYTLLQDFNTVTQWTYTGAGITDARPPFGWNVTMTDTQVVFEGSLVEGVLPGFEIDGTNSGMGQWTSGLSSGTIDGPLPIVLSSFTASVDDLDVIIRWTTESEYENMGFYIYRSESSTGSFVKINGEIIKGAGTTAEKHTYEFVDKDAEFGKTYYYYLESIDFRANQDISKIIRVDVRQLQKLTKPMVLETHLLQNFPNPFNPETWIPFRLANDADVTIRIFDIRGQELRIIHLGQKPAGYYDTRGKAVLWDGRDSYGQEVSSGIYFYNFTAGTFSATKKLTIIK